METTTQMLSTELSDYEKERGKPMPSLNHAFIQANLLDVLRAYRETYSALPELSLSLPDKPYVPDICIYPKLKPNWQRDEIALSTPPITAIEIASPTQGLQSFEKKIEAYFAAGIKSFWLVLPVNESLTVFLPNQKPLVFTTGEAVDPTTGISIRMEEIFTQVESRL